MFFNSQCNITIKPKGKQKQYYYKPILKPNNILSQKIQKNFSTTKFKQSNYINYTFSDKNNKHNHKNKSTKKYHKKFNSTFNNKHKLIIVNDYLNKLQKSSDWVNSLKCSKENSINYNSCKNFLNNTNSRNFINNIGQEINFNNNYYNEEIINKDNISKISNNNSLKTFLNDNNGQTQSKNEPYDYMDLYKEKSMKLNEELKNLLKDNNLSKTKIHLVINTTMPIFKRINILKQAKSSINRIKKGMMNSSSSSFKTFLDENNISKYNNYFLEKNKNFNENYYSNKDYYYKNDISNKRPIIIKYLPKPKLSVPKFININSIKVL